MCKADQPIAKSGAGQLAGRRGSGEPFVSVIVPCRNERAYIEGFLENLAEQDYPADRLEVIIADGRSDDGTYEWLLEHRRNLHGLRVLVNEQGIVSTGLNRAIEAARGEVIVRMDTHTRYAPDYVSQCVAVLFDTGAQNVGGPWRAEGEGIVQRAIAHAFQSRFAAGGARSHDLHYEGPVDSVYLGCWKKETLLRLGLFDEELVRNQDDELNLRIILSGGVVWQSPRIRSVYYPRASIIALWRQYAQYGYWKVRVIQKHRQPAALRHLVPGGFVAALGVSGALTPFFSGAAALLGLLAGSYGMATVLASLVLGARERDLRIVPHLPLVFGAFHMGYGYGFLRGVVDFIVLGRGGQPGFRRLTRGG